MASWDMTGLNQGFMNPQKNVGMVVFNTKISRAMVTRACSSRTPYYKPAEGAQGQYRDYVTDVGRGDIIWMYYDENNALEYMNNDSERPYGECSTVKAIATLDGHGDASETNITFMSKIRILGAAEIGKEKEKERWTTACGGIMTVRNNGPQTITVGDKVIAWAPARDETPSVKNTKEKAGVRKLQYRPFRVDLHRNQVKELYACLSDKRNTVPYLPAYKRHARQVVDSSLGMTMVTIAWMMPFLKPLLARPLSNERTLKLILEHCHYEKDHPEDLLKLLFAPHGKHADNSVARLFKDDASNTDKQFLNRVQKESLAALLMSTSALTNVLDNLVMGDAKSTAQPGDDFSLALSGYSMRV